MAKKIVIIGGGFAGSEIVRLLDKNEKFETTLIDNKNYFEFTPSVVRVIGDPTYTRKIQAFHEHYLKNSKVFIGKAYDIKYKEKKVVVKTERGEIDFDYDYLIIASGSDYSPPFKDSDIVLPVRARRLKEDHKKVKEAKKVLIVGGGLVGVEIAGEILDHYKVPQEKEIKIIHSKNELIERNNKKTREYAKKYLEKKGVEILFDDKVIKINKNMCETQKGEKFKSDIIFSCIGIKPNYEFMKTSLSESLDEHNQIKVNNFFQVMKKNQILENVFAIGDITAIQEEKTAQNAEKHAHIMVKNLINLENGYNLIGYISSPKILVISLGKFNGILIYKDFTLTGLIPAFIKKYIEVYTMMKYKR